MQKPNDLNQSRIVLKQDSTLIAIIEMSFSSWLVAGRTWRRAPAVEEACGRLERIAEAAQSLV
jgi:hypothetical protein